MKIYEIGTGYTPIPAQMGAATEIVVEELTKAFLKMGIPVEIIDIASRARKENDLPIREVWVPPFFSGTDVKLGIMHKLKRVVYSVYLALTLQKLLKKETEKVILHFHNQYNLFFFLKLTSPKLRQKAVIAYTNHSHVWHGNWEDIAPVIQRRYFQEVYCMKHADHVFVLNQKTADHIVNHIGVGSEKVICIDNGVNTDTYHRMKQVERDVLLGKYGLRAGTVFVQAGSVCERKNQLEALRLLLPFLQADRNVVYCYAGSIISAEYQESIMQFAAQNGVSDQVRYFGELAPGEELNAFYNLADAMIFPTRAEGFSLVILEAMAAGLPVLVSNHLQFRLADQCFRFGNGEEFQRILQENVFNAEVRHRCSCKVRHAVEAAYGWEKVARDYLQTWMA